MKIKSKFIDNILVFAIVAMCILIIYNIANNRNKHPTPSPEIPLRKGLAVSLTGPHRPIWMLGNAENDIEIARQVWGIDSLNNPDDQDQMIRLTQFLRSDEIPVVRAAARKFVLPQFSRYSGVLLNVNNKSRLVRGTITLVLAVIHETNDESGAQALLSISDSMRYGDLQGTRDDIETIFKIRGWFSLPLDKPVFNWMKGYTEVYSKLQIAVSNLKENEKIPFLIDKVWSDKTPMECEAATNVLINEFGQEAIPPILKLLNNPANIPTAVPPPYDKLHGQFENAIDLVISIPDNKAIKTLEKLVKSKNGFVADKASDAIKWVRSGVPFPYKYKRLMMMQYYW